MVESLFFSCYEPETCFGVTGQNKQLQFDSLQKPLLKYASVLQINVINCVTACFLPTTHQPSEPPASVQNNS